ncbi:hypothetical protein LshimejAT787_0906000 [Lyophyllum shimeji]|uniref:Uncharacterized protein n=1 Tax=Lyophyllum shimeji TaxID=47721 RepID=A0A9P3PRH2_LYOSH|nr:hypothetical protein LshimejAT787_0906000 [Lyophyllum shimeji]
MDEYHDAQAALSPQAACAPCGTPSYQLKMSTLCRFLALTPLLEDLTMSNTIPLFDTLLPDDNLGAQPGVSTRPRVQLPHLRRFEWSYPYPGEVHFFITFFDVPALEKMDIWVEEPRRSTDWHISGHHNDLMSQASVRRDRTEHCALRDLSLQCDGENTFHALRKFDVPFLEQLEITNADRRAREGGKPFPALPRLESILRDPRLPHLTHLTLSHFDLTREPDRCAEFFGYLPALTSLSLDSCVGARKLLETFGEVASGPPWLLPGSTGRRRRIKVCPRLEAISLWSCYDVKVMDVCAVVMARSIPKQPDEGSRKAGTKHTVVKGATRKIRPLPKSRYQALEAEDRLSTHGVGEELPNAVPLKDFNRPAKIMYVRIEDCPGISFSDTLVLKHLCVGDIVHNGRRLDS